MSLFKKKWLSTLAKRLIIAKWIGFIFWLIGFFLLPIFGETDLMFRFAILFWYTTMWLILWIMWFMDKHPIFNIRITYWCRWMLIWAWMNFVLALFMYNNLITLMKWTTFEWYSPFCIVIEWLIIWLIIEYFATKYAWEGKNLLK